MIEAPILPRQCLFFSVLYRSDLVSLDSIQILLESKFGTSEIKECSLSTLQSYYAKEMGGESKLRRVLVLFPETFVSKPPPVDVKKWSMSYEVETAMEKSPQVKRVINLDPGLIALENMQLLTSKPYSHRIHLGDGVYSDLTYEYKDKQFHTLPWTYPDYASEELIHAFQGFRDNLKQFILTKS